MTVRVMAARRCWSLLFIVAASAVPTAVAGSPVFLGDVFRNSLRSTSAAVRTGAASALRNRSGSPTLIRIPSSTSAASRRGRPLHIGFGLGLPIVDDILEPIEMLWEFYCARDEIQEQMLENAAKVMKKNSVRALGLTGAAALSAELLARIGCIGDRGEGLVEYIKENKRWKDRVEDRMEEQMPGVVARTVRSGFRRYRDLPERVKFTMAFSAGSIMSQTLINAAVSAVKLGLTSVVVLETLAFTGVIGEPGESIVEWVDDHDDEIKAKMGKKWGKKIKRFRKSCRKYASFDGVVELYEAAVDEEKVATFGLGLGMMAGSLV